MIFSSMPFIFAFLPITLIGYYLASWFGRRAAAAWLIGTSLFFYGYWIPSYLILLLISIGWNFAMGAWIFAQPEERDRAKLVILWAAIIGNLALLGYYKYYFPVTGFMAAHHLISPAWEGRVLLPLGISFFTFTQIGYLVDSYDGRAKERGLLSYMLFVTFFPHLIAGPILHNREIMPQFGDAATYRFRADNLSIGVAIFVLGMAKKVLLADPLGWTADAIFGHSASLSTHDAWIGALSYSLQLYFDFSGYSDMAIGLARMFNVTFPVNFNSPYKALSIIDFWSRWHMTLTRYLTLYLYNPIAVRITRARAARGLAVTRKAMRNLPAFASMVALPTFFTMALAGIWHGAGLQFLIFGLLHASYLTINHGWRIFGPDTKPGKARIVLYFVLTYGAVLIGQIFFRAPSAGEAVSFIATMLGQGDGASMIGGDAVLLRIALSAAICLALPNVQQIMRDYDPILEKVSPVQSGLQAAIRWRPTVLWGATLGVVLLIALLRASDVSKFLYFQF